MIFKTPSNNARLQSFCAALCLLCLSLAATAQQQPQQQTNEQTDDVVRITTELVQTDVMVFDKQGRFVDGLRPEQFELQLGGKQQEVSFFERVTAGSLQEAAQLSNTRASTRNAAATTMPAVESEQAERGRLIFFFLDDLHMSAASVARARQSLQRFVDNSMNPYDQVAIVSSSGQVGFLQQLTDNNKVLHAAIKRLGYKQNPEAYTGNTQISEYMASQVMDYGNRELYAYLLESIKLEQQMGPGNRNGDHRLAASYSAAPYLRNRLRQVNSQGRITTADTLSALRSLMLSSATLTGRKLVFFLSDGFIINERKSGALEMLKSVTDAAARAGAVVYTVDLRGTVFGIGSGVDASSNGYADLSARRVGTASGEINATQEPLHIIADETGGRAILNNNSIDDAILQAIRETSNYYLLAWRPGSAELRDQRSRLKVSVKGRPDLRVRLRSTSFNVPASAARPPADTNTSSTAKDPAANASKVEASKDEASKVEANKPEANVKAKAENAPPHTAQVADAELIAALASLYPQRGLPASVAVGYLNTSERGAILKISMQTERAAYRFDSIDEGQKALVDVLGAAIDDRGQFMSFKQVLTITPDTAGDAAARQLVIWHQQLNLKPGLYQVRVALRERNTGRVGSCMQWIEIPDLSKNILSLSSLFLGERRSEAAPQAKAADGARAIMVDVDHRFARSSVLRYQTYVYNAARAGNTSPDVWIQAQILRSNQQVMTTAPARVPITVDTARLPFWSEIALDQLPPGRYVLQVTATDRAQQRTASERVNFAVE